MAIFRLDRLGPGAAALLRVLGAPPGAALVGGAVRDTVLGRAVADVDVAVPSGALDLARRCAERLGGTCVVLDAERGAARVVTDGGLTLDLTDFRAPSLEGDLAARDFTVDALAVPLAPLLARGRAAIVDRTGGLADLKARRLRPAVAGVLDDDPLRALRGVRLEATLGLRLTAAAARAARQAVFFFQAEDGIRDYKVTGVQTCALPISIYWTSKGSRSLSVCRVNCTSAVWAWPGAT